MGVYMVDLNDIGSVKFYQISWNLFQTNVKLAITATQKVGRNT